MAHASALLLILLLLGGTRGAAETEWIPLWNGMSLDGWKASEKAGTFRAVDGVLIIRGARSHLFYVGPVQQAIFRNFEARAEVLTRPGANSGLYFHTRYQASGWPRHGYEVQINNSHADWRRTGSLYGIVDVRHSPARDDEWFTLRLRVANQRIQIWVNETLTVDYVEPPGVRRAFRTAGRRLSPGTFAWQGHDAASEVQVRRFEVRPLSD